MRPSDLRLVIRVGVSLLLAVIALPAQAMTFSTVTRSDGLRIVLAEGPVAEGDADRLGAALRSAGRDIAGFKVMALDSPGGPVVEAFAMVAVMDRERVATVVQSGASCASACAQILFLSGGHRAIEGDGRLGLHACHTAGDRTRSIVCNELIAQNAMARGTPYGSIMVFLQLTGPSEMKWIGRDEARYLGLTRPPPAAAPPRERQVRASL